jgi:hypothetical protein
MSMKQMIVQGSHFPPQIYILTVREEGAQLLHLPNVVIRKGEAIKLFVSRAMTLFSLVFWQPWHLFLFSRRSNIHYLSLQSFRDLKFCTTKETP